jgi:myo-inositol-1-phosphate synthase
MKTIKVAIVGVGSCSSALIQGIQFYKNNPEFQVGLTYESIGGYTANDIEFAIAFDVDKRKVGKPISIAVFETPNCNMRVVDSVSDICTGYVYRGPTLDGIADHMRSMPEEISFVESEADPITYETYKNLLKDANIDVLLNYVPVGSRQAAAFYIEGALEAGVHVVNCMPTYISTEDAKKLEKKAILNGVTIVGSDMRSAFGASRLSEVIQGSMLDSGLKVTQHIQMNMAAGTTQGQEAIINGRSANTDFLNMKYQYRLEDKHVSKENVLSGQNKVRNESVAGCTMYAGPSLTVEQKPGGKYMASDNKIANLDIVAYGWAGARYELTARLSVQDSPNSGGIVFDALRFCKVAAELGIKGYLRGVSAWTQKTPPLQMKTSDSKFECDALSRRITTPMVERQIVKTLTNEEIDILIDSLDWTFQKATNDYE